jgi:Fe-S cluster biogenesis protein NfuA
MSEQDLKTRVLAAIEKVRPALMQDGGDVEVLEVTEDGEVKVKLQGHCYGCPFSQMTVKNLVERVVRQEVPEIKKVTNVL